MMILFYQIAFQLGLTPWEEAAETHGPLISVLLERETADRDGPGSALDPGCGTKLAPQRSIATFFS